MKNNYQNSLDSFGEATDIIWRKSSFSNLSGNCLEVAEKHGDIDIEGLIHVHDSKYPKGGMLMFTEKEWLAFLEGVHQGEFNLQ